MKALELLNSGSYKLQKHKIKTHRLDSEILLSKVLNKSREETLVRLNQNMKITEVFAFDNLIQRRLHKEPIAYIINEKEFWSKKFKVNTNTLIPRPETELLVENLIRFKFLFKTLNFSSLIFSNFIMSILSLKNIEIDVILSFKNLISFKFCKSLLSRSSLISRRYNLVLSKFKYLLIV